ncbi:MAG: GNAT family N-acetyltransferase [Legionellales bacterium]|nr:GNAT family N-acetyltransferase [Legionellales bacterium]
MSIQLQEFIQASQIIDRYYWTEAADAVYQDNEITAVKTFLNYPGCNVVLAHHVAEDQLADQFNKINAFYGPSNYWSWEIFPWSTPKTLETFLTEQGLQKQPGQKYYAKALHDVTKPKLPHDLLIQRVETEQEMDQWLKPVIQAFQLDPQNAEFDIRSNKRLLQKPQRFVHYTGYLEDEPILAAVFTCHPPYVRIDSIATLPRFQGKGYGRVFVERCLANARGLGYEYAFLATMPKTEGFYTTLEFQPIASYYSMVKVRL